MTGGRFVVDASVSDEGGGFSASVTIETNLPEKEAIEIQSADGVRVVSDETARTTGRQLALDAAFRAIEASVEVMT